MRSNISEHQHEQLGMQNFSKIFEKHNLIQLAENFAAVNITFICPECKEVGVPCEDFALSYFLGGSNEEKRPE